MSYDLETLAGRSGLKIASLVFATGTDLAGTSFIPSVAGGQAIIHQIAFLASGFATFQICRSTAAASGYWTALGNQTGFIEPVRIPVDVGSAAFLSGANGLGNGFVRAWYTTQAGTTGTTL